MRPKILAISLLRLGDIILATPVLRGLRERHPNAEIHLLINSLFAQIAEMIPYVDKVHLFERNELQKGLGEAQLSLFEPYERLREFVTKLDGERFTQVINLTHNRLSGYLVSLIKSADTVGLSLESQGLAHFNSPWFRYLNTQAENEGEDVFHYTDIFRFALGLDGSSLNPTLVETEAGRAEAAEIRGNEFERYILVQPFTSDAKKDWGTERFAQCLKLVSGTDQTLGILVLGAPNEKQRLEPLVAELQAAGINARLAICSLAGALSLLKNAQLLLTGDTSIKHLASAAKTPLVELSLGSSDYRRTGAYLQNSLIVQTKELCAPCPHSKACHRDHHACAKRMQPEAVAMVVTQALAGNYHQLSVVAKEYASEIEILRVEMSDSGFWHAWSVAETFTEARVARLLAMCGQKIMLEEQREEPANGIGELGTEALKLERLFRKIYPQTSEIEWEHLFESLERQAQMVDARLQGFESGLKSLVGKFEDREKLAEFVRSLITFRERLKTQAFLNSAKVSLDSLIEDDITPPFVRFRRINDAVNELRSKTVIEMKIIRTLRSRMEASA